MGYGVSRFAVLPTLAAVVAVATSSSPPATAGRRTTWPEAVTRICTKALLFEGPHQVGNRAGAVAVAQDIRGSTARRLRRIRALPIRPAQPRLSARWLTLEQRLA